MFAYIPRGRDQRRNQTTRKDAACLEGRYAENLARVLRISLPVVDDVQDLRTHNSAENYQDPEVPCVIAVHTLALGIADTDPKAHQDADGDQQSIGRQEKTSNVEKLWQHCLVRCRASAFVSIQFIRRDEQRNKSRPTLPCGGPRMNPSLTVGTRRDPLGISAWRSIAHRIVFTSRVPVHSVLVQKSVTTITNLAGRLSNWMLGKSTKIRKCPKVKRWQLVCSTPRAIAQATMTLTPMKNRQPNDRRVFNFKC